MIRTNLSRFPDILEYFKKYSPRNVNTLNTIPIIKVDKKLWDKLFLNGYGYLVRKEDMLANYTFLEAYSQNQNLYNSLPSEEHKRDVNIYKISKQLDFPDIFVLVIDDANAARFFILHEFSHLCGIDESFVYNQKFNDEYLDKKTEQSAYYNEIRYAKQNNMSFEQYFKLAHPNEFAILEGGKQKNPETYELALLDKKDYNSMWNNIND